MVDLKNVTKKYNLNHNQFCALKNINLKINTGDLLGIVGSSGSGKSTLMNIIGFLDRPSSGDYLFLNNETSGLSNNELSNIRNKKIGFVFQSFFLLPRMTALQNIMLPLYYNNENKKNSIEKSLEILNKVGMYKYAHNKPNELSGGQQQRVAIARALVNNPDIILADEPTGALDSKTSGEVIDLFLDLNGNESRTIVMITHDKDISNICKKVVTLNDGEIA
ncbi:ABC transporter ATP-binding protein [Gammaproteobacteria bacterium]|nr:ABC transporter ATP-binding protein [Gammaproteobacteria bacterium]